MKITETHNIDEDYDYGKGSVSVEVVDDTGNRETITIIAGEPEDAVFFRDLNGAYSISKAIKLAYEAGKRGELLEYEFINENSESE